MKCVACIGVPLLVKLWRTRNYRVPMWVVVRKGEREQSNKELTRDKRSVTQETHSPHCQEEWVCIATTTSIDRPWIDKRKQCINVMRYFRWRQQKNGVVSKNGALNHFLVERFEIELWHSILGESFLCIQRENKRGKWGGFLFKSHAS